jgi:hypothetical protein
MSKAKYIELDALPSKVGDRRFTICHLPSGETITRPFRSWYNARAWGEQRFSCERGELEVDLVGPEGT